MLDLKTVFRACALFALVAGCARHNRPNAGSESHFLSGCDSNADCGELSCVGGVCSLACSDDGACADLAANAECRASNDADTQRVCDVPCEASADCRPLGEAFACDASRCRERESGEPSDAGEPSGPTEAPLGEAVEVAFKAGYFEDEQVWLQGDGGELRRISTWPAEPGLAGCEASFLSGGYAEGSGRFSDLAFDPSGRYLIMAEKIECDADAERYRHRVKVYDVTTGRADIEQTIDARYVSLSKQGGVSVVVARDALGPPQLYEFTGAAIEPIAITAGQEGVNLSSEVEAIRFAGFDVLLVSGLPALQKEEGTWTHLPLLDQFAGAEIQQVRASPSGAWLCGIVGGAQAGEAATGFVVGYDEQVLTLELSSPAAFPLPDCVFSDDERKVAFDGVIAALGEGSLVAEGTELSGFAVAGFHDGGFYGVQDSQVVRVDAATGASEVVLGSQAGLCEQPLGELAFTQLLFAPDDRRFAVLKQSCGCEDCDISASVALDLDTGVTDTLEVSWAAGHEVYALAWPPRGGVLLFSTQAGYSDGTGTSEPDRMPVPGSYRAVSPGGAVENIGPLAGVDGVVHGPVAPASRPAPIENPIACEIEAVADELLAGAGATDCGTLMQLGGSKRDAAQCALDAAEADTPFRVIWALQGIDSQPVEGFVGRVEAGGLQLYHLRGDRSSFGRAPEDASVTWSRCRSLVPGVPCDDGSSDCLQCAGEGYPPECGCFDPVATGGDIEVRCGP